MGAPIGNRNAAGSHRGTGLHPKRTESILRHVKAQNIRAKKRLMGVDKGRKNYTKGVFEYNKSKYGGMNRRKRSASYWR